MAEEKKPKIDLKARLGKGSGGAGAGVSGQRVSAPPGGIPAPVIPPPVGGIPVPLSSGIPMPPGYTPPVAPPRQSRPPTPTVDPSDPYATVKATPAMVKPQEIKVDVGEAAVEATKAMRKYIVIAGVAAAFFGILIGYVVGTGAANSAAEKSAIVGANALAGDVEKANAKIKEFAEKLQAASASIKAKKFPETFASDLGGLNIPFDGEKLEGKGINRYGGPTLKMLLAYTSDVSALNDRKDALKGLFSGQKKRIIETLEAADKPTIAYTLLITKTPKGMAVGSLAPIQDPFALDAAEWPKKYKMQNLTTREVQEVDRYDSGEPFSNREKRLGVPIEPASVGQAFPNDITGRILSEVLKTAELLSGSSGGETENDKPGLIKNGEALVTALRKIGAK